MELEEKNCFTVQLGPTEHWFSFVLFIQELGTDEGRRKKKTTNNHKPKTKSQTKGCFSQKELLKSLYN